MQLLQQLGAVPTHAKWRRSGRSPSQQNSLQEVLLHCDVWQCYRTVTTIVLLQHGHRVYVFYTFAKIQSVQSAKYQLLRCKGRLRCHRIYNCIYIKHDLYSANKTVFDDDSYGSKGLLKHRKKQNVPHSIGQRWWYYQSFVGSCMGLLTDKRVRGLTVTAYRSVQACRARGLYGTIVDLLATWRPDVLYKTSEVKTVEHHAEVAVHES